MQRLRERSNKTVLEGVYFQQIKKGIAVSQSPINQTGGNTFKSVCNSVRPQPFLVLFRVSVRRRRTKDGRFLESPSATRACRQASARGVSSKENAPVRCFSMSCFHQGIVSPGEDSPPSGSNVMTCSPLANALFYHRRYICLYPPHTVGQQNRKRGGSNGGKPLFYLRQHRQRI